MISCRIALSTTAGTFNIFRVSFCGIVPEELLLEKEELPLEEEELLLEEDELEEEDKLDDDELDDVDNALEPAATPGSTCAECADNSPMFVGNGTGCAPATYC